MIEGEDVVNAPHPCSCWKRGPFFLCLVFSERPSVHIFSLSSRHFLFTSHLCDHLPAGITSSTFSVPFIAVCASHFLCSAMQRYSKSIRFSIIWKYRQRQSYHWCRFIFYFHAPSEKNTPWLIFFFIWHHFFFPPLFLNSTLASFLARHQSFAAGSVPSASDIFRVRRTCENSVFIVPLWLIIQRAAIWRHRPAHEAGLTLCEESGIRSPSLRFRSAAGPEATEPEWDPPVVDSAVLRWPLCDAECQSWAWKPFQPHGSEWRIHSKPCGLSHS